MSIVPSVAAVVVWTVAASAAIAVVVVRVIAVIVVIATGDDCSQKIDNDKEDHHLRADIEMRAITTMIII